MNEGAAAAKTSEGEEEEKKGDASKESSKQKPLNEEIVKQIEKLLKYYTAQNDKGRMFGYNHALRSLRAYDKPIYSADQLVGVPGIGEGILKKIRELISEGTIKRFEFIDTDKKV